MNDKKCEKTGLIDSEEKGGIERDSFPTQAKGTADGIDLGSLFEDLVRHPKVLEDSTFRDSGGPFDM